MRLMTSRYAAVARTHNAYMAEMDYGKSKMDPFRVCEPKPTYGTNRDTMNDSVVH